MLGQLRISLTKSSLLALISISLFSGCAGYNRQSESANAGVRTGAVSAAIADLESKNTGADKNLLYYFEKGELLRLKGDYTASAQTWREADRKVVEWEELAKNSPSKLLGDVGSFVANDTTRRYDGRDYEKVLLNVRIALDHLALGDWNSAQVEIKKMHEREAIIADFRAKDLDDARRKANDKGLAVRSFRDIKGYPVETLDSYEVNSLKNSYESAFANYLAGFIYEAQGETSLAAAGYRKAIEMRPNVPQLDAALGELDSRVANKNKQDVVDTLFVIETGRVPAITSRSIPIPLPIPHKYGVRMIVTAVSWPVLAPQQQGAFTTSMSIDGESYPTMLLTSVDSMARRALADEMPGIIARSSVRAIVKGAAQAATQEATKNAGLAGALVSLAVTIASVASETADERIWRTLPDNFSIVRAKLKPGAHKISLSTASGTTVKDVMVSAPYSVVVLRQTEQASYLAQMPYVEPVVLASNETAAVELPKPLPEVASKPEQAKSRAKSKTKVSVAENIK
jgi:hypothetical protein